MFEELLDEVYRRGIKIVEHPFKTTKLKALYTDGVITFNKSIDFTLAEKVCTLVEEIGHDEKSVGDILDQSDISKRKQELRARQWGYERLIPLSAIVQAYYARVSGRHEISEFLEVTEEFLQSTIDRYTEKYGLAVVYEEKYIIRFDPLGVAEIF